MLPKKADSKLPRVTILEIGLVLAIVAMIVGTMILVLAP